MNSSQAPHPHQYPSDLLQRLRELALANHSALDPSQSSVPVPSTSKQQPSPKKKVSVSSNGMSEKPEQKQQNKAKQLQEASSSNGSTQALSSSSDKGNGMDDTISKQMDALKKLLECPVCLQMSSSPMYLCTHGHSICHGCRQKILKCPLCQHPILNTRNLLAEQIIGTLDTKCPYTGEGCTVSLMELDKKKHQAICHFRPIECNFSGVHHNCKKSMVKYSNFLKHMMTVHSMNGIKGTTMNVSQYVTPEASQLTTDIPWHEWPVQYMEACNQTFITGSTIIEGVIFWWLYVFGDRQTADKYRCKIVLQNKTKGLELSWSGPVFHIRTQPKIIKKTGMCLIANKDQLKSFYYDKSVLDNANNAMEKIAWDLVFHVFKKTGPTPAMSTPNGLNMT